jgi:hypothetical protein
MYLDPDGLDCIYATDNGKGVESIDHNSSSKECGGSGGTWVPGTVTEDHAAYNPNNGQIQAASYDGGKVDFATFKAGATTDGDGNCESGCGGYQFASANAAWLASMEHGGSLGDMMSFAVNRFAPIHGMVIPGSLGRILEQILSGPLDFWNDHWAGPSGMGAPHGQNDWAAMAHDYNYDTNHIKIGMYFDPSISPATARALIQSNNTLMQNSGGLQGAKFRLVFGAIDAFQAHAHDF